MFVKTLNIKLKLNTSKWDPRYSMQSDARTDEQYEANGRCLQFLSEEA